MELATYLETSRLTHEAFAEQIGVSVFAVGKYARKQRTPRPEIMARIKRATEGAVTADDFLPQLGPLQADAIKPSLPSRSRRHADRPLRGGEGVDR